MILFCNTTAIKIQCNLSVITVKVDYFGVPISLKVGML